ncbi:MAG: hypothetical protein ACI4B3_09350 [Prevotella sp.]
MKAIGIDMAARLLLYTSLFPIRQQSCHHSIDEQEYTEKLHPEVGEPYAFATAEDFFKFHLVFLQHSELQGSVFLQQLPFLGDAVFKQLAELGEILWRKLVPTRAEPSSLELCRVQPSLHEVKFLP